MFTRYYLFLLMFSLLLVGKTSFAQKEWTLVKDRQWIQIYSSDMTNSSYKRIKVECTIDGTLDKLVSVLNNVNNHKNWIYSSKTSRMLKKISNYDYYYYTETSMPWPMQNRDAIVHLQMKIDSVNKVLRIAAYGEPNYLANIAGKVRVPRSANSWLVTVPAPNKIHIIYIFEADPGGSLPVWLVNAFVDKGPYESFRKLAEELKR